MKLDLDYVSSALTDRMDTRPLRAAILGLKRVRETARPGGGERRRLTKSIKRLLRQLLRAEIFNQRIFMKWSLLTDGAWRRRVLAELGGEPALQKWEARKAKADITIREPRIIPYKDPIETEQSSLDTHPKPKRIKTDASGLFRLPPIRARIRPCTWQENLARDAARLYRQALTPTKPYIPRPASAARVPLIPVTPDELRGIRTAADTHGNYSSTGTPGPTSPGIPVEGKCGETIIPPKQIRPPPLWTGPSIPANPRVYFQRGKSA